MAGKITGQDRETLILMARYLWYPGEHSQLGPCIIYAPTKSEACRTFNATAPDIWGGYCETYGKLIETDLHGAEEVGDIKTIKNAFPQWGPYALWSDTIYYDAYKGSTNLIYA